MKTSINRQFGSQVRHLTFGAAACVGLSGALAATAQDSRYALIDLGNLGGNRTVATAMSDSGLVVGWAETAAPIAEVHAFLWESSQMIDLGTLGGGSAEATDVNDAGQIVGWSTTADGQTHGFYWYDGVMIDLNNVRLQRPEFQVRGLADLASSGGAKRGWCFMPDPTFVAANAISEGGMIVAFGQVFDWPEARGYLLAPTKQFDPLDPSFVLYDLGLLPYAEECVPFDVNEAGVVVGQSGGKAFMWLDYEIRPLELPMRTQYFTSAATALNNTGLVAGWTDYGPGIEPLPKPAVWTSEYRIDLGLPAAWIGQALEINDTGQVVGWAGSTLEDSYWLREYAMFWDGTCLPIVLEDVTQFPLGPTAWAQMNEATDIDESGRIVGYGRYADGRTAAYLLVPIDSGGN
jgi:probable HAF family extracellular repeat protein